MNEAVDGGPVTVPTDGDEEVIASAIRLLHDFDNTPLSDMTPLFYQHGFEELTLAVRDLLRLLGHGSED